MRIDQRLKRTTAHSSQATLFREHTQLQDIKFFIEDLIANKKELQRNKISLDIYEDIDKLSQKQKARVQFLLLEREELLRQRKIARESLSFGIRGEQIRLLFSLPMNEETLRAFIPAMSEEQMLFILDEQLLQNDGNPHSLYVALKSLTGEQEKALCTHLHPLIVALGPLAEKIRQYAQQVDALDKRLMSIVEEAFDKLYLTGKESNEKEIANLREARRKLRAEELEILDEVRHQLTQEEHVNIWPFALGFVVDHHPEILSAVAAVSPFLPSLALHTLPCGMDHMSPREASKLSFILLSTTLQEAETVGHLTDWKVQTLLSKNLPLQLENCTRLLLCIDAFATYAKEQFKKIKETDPQAPELGGLRVEIGKISRLLDYLLGHFRLYAQLTQSKGFKSCQLQCNLPIGHPKPPEKGRYLRRMKVRFRDAARSFTWKNSEKQKEGWTFYEDHLQTCSYSNKYAHPKLKALLWELEKRARRLQTALNRLHDKIDSPPTNSPPEGIRLFGSYCRAYWEILEPCPIVLLPRDHPV